MKLNEASEKHPVAGTETKKCGVCIRRVKYRHIEQGEIWLSRKARDRGAPENNLNTKRCIAAMLKQGNEANDELYGAREKALAKTSMSTSITCVELENH